MLSSFFQLAKKYVYANEISNNYLSRPGPYSRDAKSMHPTLSLSRNTTLHTASSTTFYFPMPMSCGLLASLYAKRKHSS
jgi:hypothetical protein